MLVTARRLSLATALTLTLAPAPLALAHDQGRPGGAAWKTLDGRRPLVIGHRGASGYRPDHTLESYKLAIALGADFIEPDLVSTSDGHLVARHEPVLDGTTDVAGRPQFAGKKTTRLLDGVVTTGWFAGDFTLAEIKQLRAIQPRGDRSPEFNGKFAIPTLEEVIELARKESRRVGRTIGIYPEIKHGSYHYALGLPIEDRLIETLQKYDWDRRDAPVFIQSFETASLKYLRTRTDVRLVQLIDADDVALDGTLSYAPPFDKPYNHAVLGDPRGFGDLVKPASLAEIASFADGIGPWKRYIVSVKGRDANGDGKADDVNGDGAVNDADKTALPPTALVELAHKAGLLVHTWTFRGEASTLAADYGGDMRNEARQFFQLGVDGIFGDHPDQVFQARAALEKPRR
jgi:glycerophosphoryl diester phosphodiesterase